MCGICGFTGKRNQFILKKMADKLIHRGPDEDGFYMNEFVNLGMRRLSIIDVESGKQPIFNEDKNLVVVFNGEIYNFIELRKDLINKGHTFYTDHSDTEVIVHLYEEYGMDFPNKINGMFAIALWDQNNKKLILVRDRMGVKPLFYSLINNQLVFASEIKSILEYPEYKKEINLEAVYHYFSYKHVPAPYTAFKGIYSTKPGEIITFQNRKLKQTRWWRIRYQENTDLSTDEIKNKIMSILEDATRLRMISDVPFGAYLSGGVDSSSIVALMSKYSNLPIKTFSLGYEDELKNKEADLYYARKVSEKFRTDHHEYIMSYKELLADIHKVITSFDQPFSGTISTFFLTKLIQKHVKVAISGDGADELFGSYLSHRLATPIQHYKNLIKNNNSNHLTEVDKEIFRNTNISDIEQIYKRTKGDEAKWRYELLVFSDQEKKELLSKEFSALNLSTYSLLEKDFQNLSAADPLNRILEMEWNTIFPDQVLAFVDSLSMAHSVEVRSPFLDYRLVEFATQIPGNLKIRNGIVKDILKETVNPLLPEGITNRPKEGFVLPVFDWMLGKMKDFSIDQLSNEKLNKHGLFNNQYVQNLVEDYYSGNKKNASKIWNLVSFQIWWEAYFG